MGKSCCAPGCTQRYTKGSGVQFYRFPAEVDRQNLWISVLRREKWRPGEHDWLCGLHFVSVSSLQFIRRIWPFTVESSSSQMRDLAGTSDTQSDHSYESCEPATSTTTDIFSNLHYMVTTQEELSESNFDTGSSQSWPNGQQYESTESSGYFDMGERWPPLDGVWQTTNQNGGRVWDMLPMEDILEEGSSDVSNDNQPLPSLMVAKSNQLHGLLV